jgi:hypothetical protein
MYENTTKPDSDFLKNEAGLDISVYAPAELTKRINEYYLNICNAVRELYYLKPTRANVETYIVSGSYDYTDFCGIVTTVECPVSDSAERAYLFKMAQARQLQYDMNAGRAAMLRGEDMKFNLCQDTVSIIKSLGLYQRTLTCI